jgi:ABC-type Na+ efflux pump permease subunit
MRSEFTRGLWTVMRWDLLTILRDPKTLFTMFLLPLVAYPALLATMSVTEEKKQSKQAKQTLNVRAPPAFETWITSGDQARKKTPQESIKTSSKKGTCVAV